MEPIPPLETRRLILRELVPADADALFAFRSAPEVQRYNDETMAHRDDAVALIARLAAGQGDGAMRHWGVTLRGDDTVVGLFGYANWAQEHRRAEVGYCLHRGYWRRGYATEALTAIIAHGFDAMALHRIHACTWTENTASVHLLEKLGFAREGLLRDEYFAGGRFHDEALYGLLRREYKTGRPG